MTDINNWTASEHAIQGYVALLDIPDATIRW